MLRVSQLPLQLDDQQQAKLSQQYQTGELHRQELCPSARLIQMLTGIHHVSVCAVEDFVKGRPRSQLPARRVEDLRQEQVGLERNSGLPLFQKVFCV